jgi:hypothetical protein
LYPSELKFVSIRNKNAQLRYLTNELNIKKVKDGREIQLNKEVFPVYYKLKTNQTWDSKVLFMPWVPHRNSLVNGSKVIQIAQN